MGTCTWNYPQVCLCTSFVECWVCLNVIMQTPTQQRGGAEEARRFPIILTVVYQCLKSYVLNCHVHTYSGAVPSAARSRSELFTHSKQYFPGPTHQTHELIFIIMVVSVCVIDIPISHISIQVFMTKVQCTQRRPLWRCIWIYHCPHYR